MVNRRDTRGAALIIVIAIMAILTAIAVTFLSVTKQDLETATALNNGVRADLIAEAALAIAQAALNRDLLDHPNVTSNDHAWRTIYNGLAFAGKNWARRGAVGLESGGLPEIDFGNLPIIQFTDVSGQIIEYAEELYRGPRTRNWLYIPRFEGDRRVIYSSHPERQIQFLYRDGSTEKLFGSRNFQIFNPISHPFLTADFYGRNTLGLTLANDNDNEQYPLEQIHLITDVDTDGDGLNDAIWLPIPADIFFDNDGIDNDLDSFFFVDPDTNVTILADLDEANEAGTFVYHGLGGFVTDPGSGEPILDVNGLPRRVGDGLDNDGNGIVDDLAEDRLFLTSPLPGRSMQVDINGDGIFDSDDFVLDTSDPRGGPVAEKKRADREPDQAAL